MACALTASPALAQRVNDNAVANAEDAFGVSIGSERVGLYSSTEVRGFSPISAGNIRLEGLYMDRPASFTDRLVESNVVRVGPAAQSYPFPAPTGVVDYRIRPAGPARIISTVLGYGPMGGGRIEVDAQLPLSGDLSLVAGAAVFQDEYASGSDAFLASYGLAGRWRPAAHIEVIPFWSRIDTWDREATPLYVGGPAGLPPQVERRRYVGPNWADQRNVATNFGVLGRGRVGETWEVAAGVFRSMNHAEENHAFLITDIKPDGLGRRLLTRDPEQKTASTSGEVKVTRRHVAGDFLHIAHASVRGRARDALYGGGATVDLGLGGIEEPVRPAEPIFQLRPTTRDEVRQWSAGVGYEARWRGRGSVNVGVQRTDYRKTVARPGAPETEVHDPAWLYNAAATVNLSERLAAYASITRGLEESGVAPDSAANRTQALPAIITDQWDVGVRWALSNNLRLVAGLFDVSKPYFAADETNVFRELGLVRHRGVELSLAGSPTPDLSLVGGAVLMSPRVEGAPVEQGRIGSRPVGQTEQLLTLSGTYQLPVEGLSFTFAANHHAARTADQLNRFEVPAATIVDLGLRYRFELVEQPALLRLQVSNVGDTFDWRVVSSGTFEVNAPRTFTLFLTVDF